jgi:3'-phosphoadenosine 5'-phosphosulfate sulfotransferase (PAPS reductase)/FAD synthetase
MSESIKKKLTVQERKDKIIEDKILKLQKKKASTIVLKNQKPKKKPSYLKEFVESDHQRLVNAPYSFKIDRAKGLIKEWYETFDGNVAVAFSGGKDSTVLLHLVRSLYPDVKALFVNTTVEFPEIVAFVKKQKNVSIIKPKMSFFSIIKKYGYPIISKQVCRNVAGIKNAKSTGVYNCVMAKKFPPTSIVNLSRRWEILLTAPFDCTAKCCDILKEEPMKQVGRKLNYKNYVGVRTEESRLRKVSWEKFGCNAFEQKTPQSRPMMLWSDGDVDRYIKENNVEICSLYTELGFKRTGCVYCMFGIDRERDKFLKLKETHPKLYNYAMTKLGYTKILDYLNIPY